jgi:hypothetical protein
MGLSAPLTNCRLYRSGEAESMSDLHYSLRQHRFRKRRHVGRERFTGRISG